MAKQMTRLCPEIDDELRDKINRLAAQFLNLHGFQCLEGHDFSRGKNGRERLMWNLAWTAYQFHIDEGLD